MAKLELGITLVIRLFFALALADTPQALSSPVTYDLVVYGGTAGGVAAAVQGARMGKKVILVEPGEHIGGLTSGGLGATDIGNKAAIGGLSREFYRRVKKHYDKGSAWKFQPRDSYRSYRQGKNDDAMWTFEPHVAERILRAMLQEAGVSVRFRARLDLSGGVEKKGATTVAAIVLEGGAVIHGRIFIDATYEGDLLAQAGVSYRVGREANGRYKETFNGVQTRNAVKHQFKYRVDPYNKAGDPSSGLLPNIHAGAPGAEGSGDRRVQAYCFRLCLTDHPRNRIAIKRPADYDVRQYELLLRSFDAGERRLPWHRIAMPNRKTDINNNHAFSTDYIGANYEYPDGGYATRERIIAAHKTYTLGLLWCLANESRVPARIRREVGRWGLCSDEFTGTEHWSHQLYVREARRMVGAYVMTQHNCQGREVAAHSVGLAAYTMDSHNVQRYVHNGAARNEGDVQVGGFPPYPIAFGAIVPQASECGNLVVPVCVSSTHIAFGSIRMEPVFMVLGQSAATIACHALDEGVRVQRVDQDNLRRRLLADGQVLEWKK